MAKLMRRMPHLFKNAGDTKVARDYLDHKLREDPNWEIGNSPSAIETLDETGYDPDHLREWCTQWLSANQINSLQQAIRMAAHHQRVYKRTVMLSPRAHMLVKTLAEIEEMKISEVIEVYLEQALRERHRMVLKTVVDENYGTVHHDIAPLASES